VLQIVRLLCAPCLFVEDVGAHVNMPSVVAVALMTRWLVGAVLRLIIPRLALRLCLWLYLPRRRAVLEVGRRCYSGSGDDGAIAGGGHHAVGGAGVHPLWESQSSR
jgi:hypothetical protein